MDKIKALKIWLKKNNLKREAVLVSGANALQKYAISLKEVSNLKDWFNDDYSNLSFDKLFNGSLRIIIPFNSEEQKELLNVVRTLKNAGWAPAGGNNFFDTKKVKQKLRRLNGGEEYEKEIEVADLKVSKKEKTIIPAGPRKGEEIVRENVSSISKVLMNPKTNTPPGLSDWWQNHQTEYAKDFNWKQIESAFNDGEVATEYSILISRDPIDVLRMSDHKNISSCHAEGNSYFKCAISESKGNGLVAYLVKTSDLDKLLTAPEPWEPDHDTGGSTNRIDIKDLDLQEIFRDPQRKIEGIEPKSRVRLRKYVNTDKDYEFAVPENRSYGPHPPGFIDRVRAWAWESQKDIFKADPDDEYISVPDNFELKMYGGSYRDSSDGELLNTFFEEGGVKTDFYGYLDTESEDEENAFEMWEQEIEQINNRADGILSNLGFFASVENEDDPYIYTSASLEVRIHLNGWEDPYIRNSFIQTESDFRPIPFGWGEHKFRELLEHQEGGEIQDLALSNDNELVFAITFECEDCANPDDVDSFLDYVYRDIDVQYDKYVERVRKKLVQNGYIAQIEFDKAAERLNSISFQNFDVIGDEEDNDGTILIVSKPDSMLMNISIPIDPTMDEFTGTNISKIFNTKTSPMHSSHRLIDEPEIILNILTKIAKEAYEATKLQLSFPFLNDSDNNLIDSDNNLIMYDQAIDSFSIEIQDKLRKKITSAKMEIEIKVSDADSHIVFVENLVSLLDDNFDKIGAKLFELLERKAKIASHENAAKLRDIYSGALAKPIINELKHAYQDDVKRLALWIEQNWDRFNNAEKETAYVKYLLATKSRSYYYQDNSLDTPSHWNQTMQQRPDTDISYHWKGPSIKDVIIPSYQDIDTEE